MKKCFTLFLLITILITITFEILCSQETRISTSPSLGLFGHFNLNQYTANFPDNPPCCPGFKEGKGNGFETGALFDFPLSKYFSIQFRGVFSILDGKFTSTLSQQKVWNQTTDDTVSAFFEKNMSAKLSLISFEPLITFRPFGYLKIFIGANAGFLLQKKFEQVETIISPSDYVFYDNGNPIGNTRIIPMSEASAFQLFGVGGITYEIPLNKTHSLSIAPEIFYSKGFTDIIKGTSWKISNLQAGLALKYTFVKSCPPGMELDETGNCIEKCREGMIRDENGKCKCQGDLIWDEAKQICLCPGRKVWDPVVEKCVCPEGMIFNEKTAQCECTNGRTYNEKTGKCECPNPMSYNEKTNKCECSQGLLWNDKEKKCECPQGLILNEKTGKCDCPNPLLYNVQTKKCECPGGGILNETTGQCECRGGAIWDSIENKCICEGGMIWNDSLSKCICPDGFAWNERASKCIAIINADVEAFLPQSIDEGKDESEIKVIESEYVQRIQLLPSIFFDEGKSTIPSRYHKYASSDEALNFSVKSTVNLTNPLSSYYHILNIIGKNLKSKPNYLITLVAYEGIGSEKGNNELQRARINEIKSYLNNIWNVGNQIDEKIEPLNSDKQNLKDPIKISLNRKVDILTGNESQSLLDFIDYKDTLQKVTPPVIQFHLMSAKTVPIKKWNLKVQQVNHTLLDTSGTGRHPETIGLPFGTINTLLSPSINQIEYSFNITFTDGRVSKSKEKTIPLKWISPQERRTQNYGDTTISDYKILIPEGKELVISPDSLGRYLNKINFDRDNSFISILVFSDWSSEEGANRITTLAKAKVIARYLNSTGKLRIEQDYLNYDGTTPPKFSDNNFPEEKFYSNRVEIFVKTFYRKK